MKIKKKERLTVLDRRNKNKRVMLVEGLRLPCFDCRVGFIGPLEREKEKHREEGKKKDGLRDSGKTEKACYVRAHTHIHVCVCVRT